MISGSQQKKQEHHFNIFFHQPSYLLENYYLSIFFYDFKLLSSFLNQVKCNYYRNQIRIEREIQLNKKR